MSSIVVVGWHILSVHTHGSSAQSGVLVTQSDTEAFSGWSLSDLSQVLSLGAVSGLLVLGYSESIAHPDAFSDLDRYQTPVHIVPEWFFLPYYAVLRSSASKLLGVTSLVASLLIWSSPGVLPAGVGSYRL